MQVRTKQTIRTAVFAAMIVVIMIIVAQKGLAWTNPTANPPFGGQAINVSAGNVGIGNATPAYKLDVSGDVNFTGTLRQNGTPFSAGNQWATNGTNIYNTNTGNVGIGTASPAVKLHLQQANAGNFFTIESTDGTSAGGYSEMRFLAGSRSGYIWVRNQNGAAGEGDGAFNIYSESGDVNLWAAATRIITVKPNSNVGIGTTDPTSQMAGTYGVAVYNASFPAIGFKNSTTNWLWYGAGSTMRLWNGSAGDILFANTSGNVGIGTATPGAKLDVVGLVRNSAPSQGTVELSGLLPGYADNTYPTLKTTGAGLYFSTGGFYTGYMGNGGILGMYTTAMANNVSINASGVSWLNGGNVGIGTTAPAYKLQVNGDVYANGGWLRTSGTAGWYSESYGGGWYMQDTSWIRAYNNKNVYTPGEVQAGTIRGNSSVCIGGDCRSAWPASGITVQDYDGAAALEPTTGGYYMCGGSFAHGAEILSANQFCINKGFLFGTPLKYAYSASEWCAQYTYGAWALNLVYNNPYITTVRCMK